jgi:signal transduction histidine kinase
VPGLFRYLARRRWAGVGLAVLVEAAILLPMAYADPSSVVGIPAAVAAAIAGTVAVVFGPLDGALVAFVGAVLFGSVGGWGAGEVAALAVWPAIVVAAGLFARSVERQRHALALLMTTQEAERQRIALELHDETAQDLTAALLALRQAESAAPGDAAAAAAEATRKLIEDTITNVRELAVELRPKALDDFGLGPAVERLAADITQRTGIRVDVEVRTGEDRLPRETELTVFRTVQEILGQMAYAGAEGGTVQIVIQRAHEEVRVLINRDSRDGGTRKGAQRVELDGLRERVRLVGGRLSATSGTSGATVRVVLPL